MISFFILAISRESTWLVEEVIYLLSTGDGFKWSLVLFDGLLRYFLLFWLLGNHNWGIRSWSVLGIFPFLNPFMVFSGYYPFFRSIYRFLNSKGFYLAARGVLGPMQHQIIDFSPLKHIVYVIFFFWITFFLSFVRN